MRHQLTPHETRLLKLFVEGHNYKTAPSELRVSVNTVNFHVRSIYGKLQVQSRSKPSPKPSQSPRLAFSPDLFRNCTFRCASGDVRRHQPYRLPVLAASRHATLLERKPVDGTQHEATVEDVLRILRARIGLLLVTLAIVSARRRPPRCSCQTAYRSETMILVQPQRLRTLREVHGGPPHRGPLQSITSRFQPLVSKASSRDFDSTADKRERVAMETVVEKMRKDIDVKVVKGSAFRVDFVATMPAP